MTEEAEVAEQISPEMKQMAALRARDKAKNARWDLNIAIFLVAVLIVVVVLAMYTKVGLEVVAPIAILGLGTVWLMGWRKGKQLYQRFYEEELSTLQLELKKTVKKAVKETVEETIEEKVQKALRERWR